MPPMRSPAPRLVPPHAPVKGAPRNPAQVPAVLVEVFGDIKRNWGFRRFLLRGLERVGHEMRMVAMGHNIRKMAYALAV